MRQAARVLLFDELDRLLLFRGLDASRPHDTPWWFTPGGGLNPGETREQAAIREVFEETGTLLPSVSGPVAEREVHFEFEGEMLHQHETFFVGRVTGIELSREGWTELEKRTMLDARWWSLAELEHTTEIVFPENLVDLVRTALAD